MRGGYCKSKCTASSLKKFIFFAQILCVRWFMWGRLPKTLLAQWHCQPESFCASRKFLRVFTKLPIKCSFNKCGKFPDCLESFKTVWRVSKESGKFPDCMESFRTVWKVFRRSGKFPDGLESFQKVWKVSR